jgi:hypothetical protein
VIETWGHMAKYEHFEHVGCTALKIIFGQEVIDDIKQLMKIKREFVMLNTDKKFDITPEMIAQARDYPFEYLYEFKRNMALCPFHNDTSPSMSLKNNKVRCWSCNKSWDTIAFVMEKEGLSFQDAVRRLQ